eukprot:scaffold407_cov110-Alexandrium_tamarense.AAC.1
MLYRKCVAIWPNIVPTSVGRVGVLFVEKGGGNPGGSSGVGCRVWETLVDGLKEAVAGWEEGVVVCGVSSTSVLFGRVVSMVSVLRWLSSFCCTAGWNETWGLPVREMSGAGPVGDGSFGESLLSVSFCVACFLVVGTAVVSVSCCEKEEEEGFKSLEVGLRVHALDSRRGAGGLERVVGEFVDVWLVLVDIANVIVVLWEEGGDAVGFVAGDEE